MTNGEAEADRCAVIEDVNGITAQAEPLGESVNDLGQMIEAVFEGRSVWRFRETETRQIRCHDTVAVGESGNELPEHMRGGGKSVQQQHGGGLRVAGLPIEDF